MRFGVREQLRDRVSHESKDIIKSMQTSTLLAILKVIFMICFVAIVVIVGTLPIRLKAFKTNPFLRSMGTTFAGALFINVSLIHILPQSAQTIEAHLKGDDQDKEVFPLANLLLIVGFLITIFFTRIIATHSHHHNHHDEENDEEEQEKKKSLLQSQRSVEGQPTEQNAVAGAEKDADEGQSRDAFFLTAAMYFHTLFEGIAIGVQNTIGGFLSIAIAIAFHKWADALSMGIHYRKNNIPYKVSMGLIIGQAVLNLIAIGIGWAIDSLGEMTEAIFLSISAGTFLAISTMQMLGEELHNQHYKPHKFFLLIFSTGFISFVWFLQNSIFSDGGDDS